MNVTKFHLIDSTDKDLFTEINAKLDLIKAEMASLSGQVTSSIEIIDRPELLKRLGITEPTAITWGKKGVIPEIRVGATVRYNWPAVIAALEVKRD